MSESQATGEQSTLGCNDSVVLAVAIPAGTRYVLHDEIARGGMGVVYHATDTTLGRPVAVKVLGERFHIDSGTARRFLDEARIAGQLQHPGIPAVHDLGTLPDGRPFLAMKLVKGHTLADLLKDRTSPAAERGRFVAVFEAVCQALGYAHAHGVIHRDLKPANIMVGTYGEVQVMDWGLAKVLASGPRERSVPETSAGTEIRTERDSDGSETQAGSVLGTPAFMPPEQAIGAIDRIDARSDVFGLGGILLVVLTGKPPFVAETSEAARQLAALAVLDDACARLDACGADPDLVALCKRCLSRNPNDRPADAGAVARAVANLRAAADERARQAELERVRAEGERAQAEAEAREQRKRQRVQLALCAAVGLLLASVGAFAWWQAEQARTVRERLGRNGDAVAGLLDQCEEALRGGDAAKATVALEAARKRVEEGGAEDLAHRLERLDADLALLGDLDDIDQFRWTVVENKYSDVAAVVGRYRAALRRFGADPDAVSPDEAATRAADSAVRDRLVAAFDQLLAGERTARVRAVLRAIDADPFRDAVRDAELANDPAKITELAARPAALEQAPGFAAFLGTSPAISKERRRQLLEAAVRRRPGDLGLLMTLVYTYYPFGQQEGAHEQLRWCQAAVAAAPANAVAHNLLGFVLRGKKDLAGAEAAYKEAIRLDAKYAAAHSSLGHLLLDRKDMAGAETACREAIRLDPKDVSAHHSLGRVLLHKEDLDGAIASFETALSIAPKHPAAALNLALAERMRGLLPRLPDILAGKVEPKTSAEACDYARLCGRPSQKRYAAAVRLFAEAFAADSMLATDRAAAHRYNAACYAVRAAGGEGIDPPADAAARAALRKQAHDWLRADLVLYQKQAASSSANERKTAAAWLAIWVADSDLASTRPDARREGWSGEEAAAWDALWSDVRAALAEANKPPDK